MEDVPYALRENWAEVVKRVLRRVCDTTSEDSLTRALRWFLYLPQALLRQSKRGGRKGQNVAEVGRRFDSALRGEWGAKAEGSPAEEEEEASAKEHGGQEGNSLGAHGKGPGG